MDNVDCMTCLIQHEKRLSTEGTYVDNAGITHSTVRWMHQVVPICVIARGFNKIRTWFVTYQSIRL